MASTGFPTGSGAAGWRQAFRPASDPQTWRALATEVRLLCPIEIIIRVLAPFSLLAPVLHRRLASLGRQHDGNPGLQHATPTMLHNLNRLARGTGTQYPATTYSSSLLLTSLPSFNFHVGRNSARPPLCPQCPTRQPAALLSAAGLPSWLAALAHIDLVTLGIWQPEQLSAHPGTFFWNRRHSLPKCWPQLSHQPFVSMECFAIPECDYQIQQEAAETRPRFPHQPWKIVSA